MHKYYVNSILSMFMYLFCCIYTYQNITLTQYNNISNELLKSKKKSTKKIELDHYYKERTTFNKDHPLEIIEFKRIPIK